MAILSRVWAIGTILRKGRSSRMFSEFLSSFSSPELSLSTMLLRLLASILMGVAIGIEREMHRQPAGMRTHILICIGATLLTMASLYLPLSVGGVELNADAARIVAQIVSGIGFLGAGAIIKFGATVRGITTAATIWVTSAIGIVVGLGLFLFALIATVSVLVVLVGFESFEQRLFATEYFKTLEVIYDTQLLNIERIRSLLLSHKIRLRTIDMQTNSEHQMRALLHIRISEKVNAELLLQAILALPSVKEVRLHQEYR